MTYVRAMRLASGPTRVVLFDAGGVLITPPFEEHVALTHGRMSVEDVRRIFYRAYSASAMPTEAGLPDFWTSYATQLGLPPNTFEGLTPNTSSLVRWNAPTANAVRVLDALKRDGFAVAVVSNAAGDVHQLLSEAGVCNIDGSRRGVFIDAIFDSGDTHRYPDERISRKPNATMFVDALNHFDVEPHEALFTGDALWADALGAARAHVRFLHMDPFGDCADATIENVTLPTRGHHHVRDLAAVPAYARGTFRAATVQTLTSGGPPFFD